MFIIDASVAIKWFIEEKDSSKALLLKENHINGKTILIAPDLLIYEVVNVILASKLFKAPEIERCLKDLYELEIDFISPSADIILCAAEFASAKQISLYDAAYLAVADELGVKLITADEKLYHTTKDLQCIDLLSGI